MKARIACLALGLTVVMSGFGVAQEDDDEAMFGQTPPVQMADDEDDDDDEEIGAATEKVEVEVAEAAPQLITTSHLTGIALPAGTLTLHNRKALAPIHAILDNMAKAGQMRAGNIETLGWVGATYKASQSKKIIGAVTRQLKATGFALIQQDLPPQEGVQSKALIIEKDGQAGGGLWLITDDGLFLAWCRFEANPTTGEILAAGDPPLTRVVANACVDASFFMIGEVIGKNLSPTEEMKATQIETLIANYPRSSSEQQQNVSQMPTVWATLQAEWPRLSEAEKHQYRLQWARNFKIPAPDAQRGTRDADEDFDDDDGERVERVGGNDRTEISSDEMESMSRVFSEIHAANMNSQNILAGNPDRYVNSSGTAFGAPGSWSVPSAGGEVTRSLSPESKKLYDKIQNSHKNYMSHSQAAMRSFSLPSWK